MKETGKKLVRLTIAAAASSMLLSGNVMAAPKDELQEILNQPQAEEPSLLSQTLGLEEIGKAIGENGLEYQMNIGFTEGSTEVMGIDGEIPENGYVSLDFYTNPGAKNWKLGASMGLTEDGVMSSLLDMALYGDSNVLTLAIPQLCSSAIAVEAGNVGQQFRESALYRLMELGYAIPDIEIPGFYPDETAAAKAQEQILEAGGFTEEAAAEFQSAQEAQMDEIATQMDLLVEQLQNNMQVSKLESGAEVVYTASVLTTDVLEIADEFCKQVYDYAVMYGTYTSDELTELQYSMEEIEEGLLMMEKMLGEKIVIDYTVIDGLVTKVKGETTIDPDAAYEEAYTPETTGDGTLNQVQEGTVAESGIVSEIDNGVSETAGVIGMEIVYGEPARPMHSFDCNIYVIGPDDVKYADILIEKNVWESNQGATELTELKIEVEAEGERVYSDTPFRLEYNSQTGDLDMDLHITDPDYGDEIGLTLDSIFVTEGAGSAFVWEIDELAIYENSEKAGVQGSISINPYPEKKSAPAEQKILFALDDAELMGLVTEISMNAETLMQNIEAALYGENAADDYEDDYGYEGSDSYDYEDGYSYEADDSYEDDYSYDDSDSYADDYGNEAVEESPAQENGGSSIILGGADGPTSIYIAGKI